MHSLQQTDQDLQKNSEFYNKFINSGVYESLQNLSKSPVVLDVE